MFKLDLEKAEEPEIKLSTSSGSQKKQENFIKRSTSASFTGASLVAQTVKHLPAMQETWVPSLGQEDPLEKEMATQSSTLAWKIPWTEKPGGLQSMGLQRIRHNRVTSFLLLEYSKTFYCVDHNKLWKIFTDGNIRPPYLLLEKPVCRPRNS